MDSLRADHLGFNGHKGAVTPNIDALAARGAVFTRALAPVPEATPSLASLLTGQYPATHGLRTAQDDALGADRVTLAEAMKTRGYRTGAFVGALLLHPKYGLDQGFDVYGEAFGDVPRPSQIPETGILAEKVVDRALEFLETARNAPFLLWVNFQDPHYFYFPPEPYATKFSANLYDGEIAYVDHQMGRLLAKLRDYGIEDRTLVVLAGTNGEGMGDRGEEYHGTTLQAATTNVPLVIAGVPGISFTAGRRVDTPVSLVDVAPTVLELTGLPPLAGAEGQTLAREATADREIYLETLMPSRLFGWAPMFGVVSGNWKYVEGTRGELFNLTADPSETKNVSDANATVRDRLAGLTRAYAARRPVTRPLPASIKPRIKALGLPVETPARKKVDPRDRIAIANDTLKATRTARRRQLDAATFLFEGVLKKDPDNYIALMDSALLEVSRRRSDAALKLLEKAQARYPEAAEPYHQMGHRLNELHGAAGAERANALFAIAAAIDSLNEEALYDTACALALAGQTGAALDMLDQAVRSGFRDFEWMAQDSDLDSLRADPRFDKITQGKAIRKAEPAAR